MSLEQAQYFYSVELNALQEQLNHSMNRAAQIREKAMRRNDVEAADKIGRLQEAIDVAQRRVVLLK